MSESNDNIRLLSAISYILVFFIVGHFAVEKDNPDLRFHKYQGAVLFAVFAVLYSLEGLILLVLSFSSSLQMMAAFLLTGAITLAYLFLVFFGVSAALQFQQKQLPFIGFFAVRLRGMMDERKK